MKSSSSSIHNENPESAALEFVKKSAKGNSQDSKHRPIDLDVNGNQMETSAAHKEPNIASQSKKKRRVGPTKKKDEKPAPVSDTRPIYEPFSTRVRRDIKLRLKRLSHQREETGHPAFKVQAMVEEALVFWLDSYGDSKE